MLDAIRTPSEQLESEAIYLLRESAVLFSKPALLFADDARSRTLKELSRRAFFPDTSPLSNPDDNDESIDAVLSAEAGVNFEVWPLLSKPPLPDTPWEIFPLASWSERDIEAFGQSSHPDDGRRRLKVCTVGEPGTGKSSVVRRLTEPTRDGISPVSVTEASPHRHLLTDQRRFFLIDPPGQEPCSHGLMAAAAACELALLVVDAERGLTTTGKRQAFLLALTGVSQLVVVINKMDRTGYSQQRYEEVVEEFQALSSVVEIKNLAFLPLSATTGENLSYRSAAMTWYTGPTLMGQLEMATPGSTKNLTDLRLPVQHTTSTLSSDGASLRSSSLSGRLASGQLAVGEQVVALPSGEQTVVQTIWRGDTEQAEAVAGDSVTLLLAEPIAVEPGDIVVSPQSLPTRSSEIEATLVWLSQEPRRGETCYTLHHGARLLSSHVSDVLARLEPESLRWEESDALTKGDIARVRITAAAPLYFDSYTGNRETGAFTLLHNETREVLATGVIRGPALDIPDVTANAERLSSDHVVKDPTLVERDVRASAYGHEAAVLWFTGLSGSGKSAVAKLVEKALFERGCHTLFLDGDNVRSGLNGDLGFTEEARTENTRRVGELAALAFEQGQIVVCSFISGKQADRDFVRSLLPQDRFFEGFVDCPIDVCRQRDPKKLYKKADAGELLSFSGVSIPYEAPKQPELHLRSDEQRPEELAQMVLTALEACGVVSPGGDERPGALVS